MRAIGWFTALVPSADWAARMERVTAKFEAGKAAWVADGTSPHDPTDPIAWLFFQAQAYAVERQNWIEEEAYRIAPIFKRIGQDIALLDGIDGARERGARLLDASNSQPDDGLFEFLVALAYRRGGWNVGFVPERSSAKTADLALNKGRQRWAAECKRAGRSGYAADERIRGQVLAGPIHALARATGRSIVLEVNFRAELAEVPADYLLERVTAFLARPSAAVWQDVYGVGQVRLVDWRLINAVLAHDDIYVGSSRMIELLTGVYSDRADYSVKARWKPGRDRPFHATSMRQASVVGWLSGSLEAAKRKAAHFRGVVGKASRQLPGDCPGVVHVGYEARGGNTVDDFRHMLNALEMRDFDPGDSRLRWVYGNYMAPEHTTAKNESAAASETTASYRIGGTRTAEPLPNHVLLDDKPARPGTHWRR